MPLNDAWKESRIWLQQPPAVCLGLLLPINACNGGRDPLVRVTSHRGVRRIAAQLLSPDHACLLAVHGSPIVPRAPKQCRYPEWRSSTSGDGRE